VVISGCEILYHRSYVSPHIVYLSMQESKNVQSALKSVWMFNYAGPAIMDEKLFALYGKLSVVECYSSAGSADDYGGSGSLHSTLIRVKDRCRESSLVKFAKYCVETHDVGRVENIAGFAWNDFAGLHAHPAFGALVHGFVSGEQSGVSPFYSWIGASGLRGGGVLTSYCRWAEAKAEEMDEGGGGKDDVMVVEADAEDRRQNYDEVDLRRREVVEYGLFGRDSGDEDDGGRRNDVGGGPSSSQAGLEKEVVCLRGVVESLTKKLNDTVDENQQLAKLLEARDAQLSVRFGEEMRSVAEAGSEDDVGGSPAEGAVNVPPSPVAPSIAGSAAADIISPALSVAGEEGAATAEDISPRHGGGDRYERRRNKNRQTTSRAHTMGRSLADLDGAQISQLMAGRGPGGFVDVDGERYFLYTMEELDLHCAKFPKAQQEIQLANRRRLRLEQENDVLRRERDEARDERDAAKKSLTGAVLKIREGREVEKELRSALDASRGRGESDHEDGGVELSAIMAALEAAKEDIDAGSEREAEMRSELERLRNALGDDGDDGGSSGAESSSLIASLTRERNAAIEERNRAVLSVERAEKECDAVRVSLASVTEELGALKEGVVVGVTRELDATKVALAGMSQELDAVRVSLSTVSEREAEMRGELERLRNALGGDGDNSSGGVELSRSLVATLTHERNAAIEERNAARASLRTVEGDHAAVLRQKEQMHNLALTNLRIEFQRKEREAAAKLAELELRVSGARGGDTGGGEATSQPAPRRGGAARGRGGR
jgi:hypothetical protein